MSEITIKRRKLMSASAEKQPHYGYRKFGMGLAAALLSTTLFFGNRVATTHAAIVQNGNSTGDTQTSETDSSSQSSGDLANPQTPVATASSDTQTQSASSQTAGTNQNADTSSVQASAQSSASTEDSGTNTSEATPQVEEQSQTPASQAQAVQNVENDASAQTQSGVSGYSAPTEQQDNSNTTASVDQAYGYTNSDTNEAAQDYSDGSSQAQAQNPDYEQSEYNSANPVQQQEQSANTVQQAQENAVQQQNEEDTQSVKQASNAVQNQNNVSSVKTPSISKDNDDFETLSLGNNDGNEDDTGNDLQSLNLNASLKQNDDFNTLNTNIEASAEDTRKHNQAALFGASLFENNDNTTNSFNPSDFNNDEVTPYELATELDEKTGTDDNSLSDTGKYSPTNVPSDAPAGTAYVIWPQNPASGNFGPAAIYKNPVTGKDFPTSDIWIPIGENIHVYEYNGTTGTPTTANSRLFMKSDIGNVQYGRPAYFDAQGDLLGYGLPANSNLSTTDPNNVKIGSLTLEHLIGQVVPNGYEVSPESLKEIKDWLTNPNDSTKEKTINIFLIPAKETTTIKYIDITNGYNDKSPVLDTQSISGYARDTISMDNHPEIVKELSTLEGKGYHVVDNPFSEANQKQGMTEIQGGPFTVTLAKENDTLGSIVPVDKYGNLISGAKKDPYKPDPSNPSKAQPNEQIPAIPGYIPAPNQNVAGYNPKTYTVSPQNPTEDTKIEYIKPGNVIPKDSATGQKIHGINEMPYDRDPNDKNKVAPTQSVPSIDGYTTKNPIVNTPTDPSADTNVIYTKNGNIVPVDNKGNLITTDGNGNPVKSRPYETDPDDPTKVEPDEDVPTVPGYHVDTTQSTPGYNKDNNTVTPKDPTKDTKIIYVKDDDSKPTTDSRDLQVIIKYVFDDISRDDHDSSHVKGGQAAPNKDLPIHQTEDANGNWTPNADAVAHNYETGASQDAPQIDHYEVKNATTSQSGNVYTIIVHYIPNDAKTARYDVQFIDENNNNSVIKDAGSQTIEIGRPNYDPSSEIQDLENKGYVLDKNDVPTGNVTEDENGKTYQVFFKHGTQEVTGNQKNPVKNPDSPEYGKDITNLSKTVPVTTKYTYDTEDGKQALPDRTQNLTFNAAGTVDLVTGKVSNITPFKTTDTIQKVLPNIDGYTPHWGTTDGDINDPNVTSITMHGIYVANPKDTDNAEVVFVDQTTGKPILTRNFNGEDGTPVGYNTQGDIDNLLKKGYKIINDETKGQPLAFMKGGHTYHVYLAHRIEQLTRKKTVTRTIHYKVPKGMKAPKPVVQKITFIDHGTKDDVTGKTTWDSDTKTLFRTFRGVASPVVNGATPNQAEIGSEVLAINSKNWNENMDENITVTYLANKPAKAKSGNSKAPVNSGGSKAPANVGSGKAPANSSNTPASPAPAQNVVPSAPVQSAPAQAPSASPAPAQTVQAATVSAPAQKPQASAQPASAPAHAPAQQAKSLPQTGENDPLASLAIGSVLAGLAVMGLYDSRRKRRA